MKKFLLFITVGNLFLACNSSSDTSTTQDSITTTNQTNVENVNGNVPDSTSGVNLNRSLPVDSSRIKDSAKKDSGSH